MMVKVVKLISLLFFFLKYNCIAQNEVLVDLQMNPVVAKKWQQHIQNNATAKLAQSVVDTILLPFLDDFSKEDVYPDTAKWMSQSVFINRTYPIAPISIGVATFDGIDSTGYPYNFSASGTSSGEADHLLSLPIDLSSYFPVDSLYLSFFYQAQGRGNAPEGKDSLVLEFKQPSTGKWDWVWSHKGYPIWDQNLNMALNKDTNFHSVILPVKKSEYLKKGFQFRFKNYATLSGNVDHWHIDYVYLNNNRTIADTVFEDVAFVYNPSPLLKKYTAMPWEQYIVSELKDSLSTTIRNSFNLTKNTSFNYVIKDENNMQLSSYTGASFNVDPYQTSGYSKYKPFSRPPLNYTIPTLTDSSLFVWESYIKAIPDLDNRNDTVRMYQKFYNYYAYDDGTAEAGYYLNSQNPNAMLAINFTLNNADTLRAVQIHFNPILNNATIYTFRLAVWNDNSGKPGTMIYKDSVVNPVYEKTDYNQFHTYTIAHPSLVLSAGKYHFGLIQLMAPETLNIGFDLNNTAQAYTMVNTSGTWQQATLKGAVMLRPVFGKNFPIVGTPNYTPTKFNFEVYPNPAQDKLTIVFDNQFKRDVLQVSLIDAYGRTVWVENNFVSQSIDVSEFSQGLYFLKVTNSNANSAVKRVVLVH